MTIKIRQFLSCLQIFKNPVITIAEDVKKEAISDNMSGARNCFNISKRKFGIINQKF